MTLPSKLVAATDFSLDASHAARRAALLAREHQLPLTLLHAIDVSALTTLTAWFKGKTNLHEALAGQARVQLAVAAEQLRDQLGVVVDAELREGSPLAELAGAAGTAGMLVVGARGAHRMRELTIGTTADRLLRKTEAPMLVVKSDPTEPYQRVLVLMDFSPASVSALTFARTLAPRAAFRLLHAFELPYEGQLFLAGVAASPL